VPLHSIEDVVTGNDSQRVFRGTIGTLTMFAPYGAAIPEPFRSKVDTLSIQYRDAEGGLHGAIFTMATGKADALKKEMVAQGAHTSIPIQDDAGSSDTKRLRRRRETMKRVLYAMAISFLLLGAQIKLAELRAQSAPTQAMKASAIQVLMIQSDEIKLPADFQLSLYENLIQQLQKQGGFQHVYRDGDRNAASVTDLVVLRSTVRGFKKGSEMARNVTTVTGKTRLTFIASLRTRTERPSWSGI